MKTLTQIRESINVDSSKLTKLVRAGLFDANKLPLLKRLLSKDVKQLTSTEKESMSTLLNNLLDQVLDNSQVFNKVRSNLQSESQSYEPETINRMVSASGPEWTEDNEYNDFVKRMMAGAQTFVYDPHEYHDNGHEEIDEKFEVAGDLPAVLVLKRKAVRVYPNGQRIALYYNEKLDTFVSIPYAGAGVAAAANQIAVSEGHMDKESEQYEDVEVLDEDKIKPNTDINIKGRMKFGSTKTKIIQINHDEKENKVKRLTAKVNEAPEYDVDVEYGEHKKPPTERFSYKIKAKSGVHANSKAEKKLRDIKGDAIYHKKILFTSKRSDGMNEETLDEHVLKTLKAIVANKQKMPVKFPDGTMSVDHMTANKILQIHDTVHDGNKEKMVNMMNKSKGHFTKVANFAMKH